MRFVRCVHAEVLFVWPRFTRTRLGAGLLGLVVALVWLAGHGLDAMTATLQSGALGAIVAAAGVVGHEIDRPAASGALTHPTTALAVATGRWLAIVLPVAALTIVCAILVHAPAVVTMAAIAALAAVAGCALAVVLLAGPGGAWLLFLCMAIAGTVAPERLVDLARPGLLRLAAASALELGPALWHYRDIARGDVGAVVHAWAWAGLGILCAAALIGRRQR